MARATPPGSALLRAAHTDACASLDAIRSAFPWAPVAVDCGCDEAYFTYVYPDQPYVIYVCNAFWSAPATGSESKAGTLVHEMSHFNVVAGTDDHPLSTCLPGTWRARRPGQQSPTPTAADLTENTPPLEGGGGGAGRSVSRQRRAGVDESAGAVTLAVRRVSGSSGVNGPLGHRQRYGGRAGRLCGRRGTLSWANGDSSGESTRHRESGQRRLHRGGRDLTVALSSPSRGGVARRPGEFDGDDPRRRLHAFRLRARRPHALPRGRLRNAEPLPRPGELTNFQSGSGPGVALSYTPDSGFFLLFNPQILELLVKVVDELA